jgi:hypothetical protein
MQTNKKTINIIIETKLYELFQVCGKARLADGNGRIARAVMACASMTTTIILGTSKAATLILVGFGAGNKIPRQ